MIVNAQLLSDSYGVSESAWRAFQRGAGTVASDGFGWRNQLIMLPDIN